MGVYWIRFKLGLVYGKQECVWLLKKGAKSLHGNESRIKAYSPQSEELALAA